MYKTNKQTIVFFSNKWNFYNLSSFLPKINLKNLSIIILDYANKIFVRFSSERFGNSMKELLEKQKKNEIFVSNHSILLAIFSEKQNEQVILVRANAVACA